MSVALVRTAPLPTAQINTSRDQYCALVVIARKVPAATVLHRALRGVEQVLAELQTGNSDEHRRQHGQRVRYSAGVAVARRSTCRSTVLI